MASRKRIGRWKWFPFSGFLTSMLGLVGIHYRVFGYRNGQSGIMLDDGDVQALKKKKIDTSSLKTIRGKAWHVLVNFFKQAEKKLTEEESKESQVQ